MKPLPPVASKYDLKRVHPMYGTVIPHTGVDYTAPAGTPVYAIADGIVERSAFDAPRWQGGTGAGNHIRINHGSGVTSRYYHLSVRYLAQGERVKVGQRIGLVGATGDATGPHLHFEIRVDGRPVEPVAYMHARIGDDDMATPAENALYLLNYANPPGRDPVYKLLIDAAATRIIALNIAGAVAALGQGETFDEAKFLAGVEASAEAGARAGAVTALADIEVVIRDVLADVDGVDADEVAAATVARIGALFTRAGQ